MPALLRDALAFNTNVPLRDGLSQDATTLARGWIENVRASARGAALLHRKGLTAAAAPIRRSMLEHAMALAYLADDPEGAARAHLRKSKETLEKKLLPGLVAEDWSAREAAAVALEALTVADAANERKGTVQTNKLAFAHALKAYRDGDNLAVVYAHESNLSHPSFTSANATQHGDDERMVLVLLIAAYESFSGLLAQDAWRAQIDELVEQFAAAINAK
jgi:hypothetical protein